jgi:NAD(P)-dependent dehydrogenase (short-subunit alcohol dehydrogenase family)
MSNAARKVVVTGSASGIGQSLVKLLKSRGQVPIGVDVRAGAGVDVVADLASPEGRTAMVDGVAELSNGVVDGVVANAGTAGYNRGTVTVNFFGALATLEGLLPLLTKSPAPRAAATVSIVTMMPTCLELVDLMLARDEAGAVAMATSMEEDPEQAALLYASSKRALARWLRQAAASPEWGGAGIPINAVGPT